MFDVGSTVWPPTEGTSSALCTSAQKRGHERKKERRKKEKELADKNDNNDDDSTTTVIVVAVVVAPARRGGIMSLMILCRALARRTDLAASARTSLATGQRSFSSSATSSGADRQTHARTTRSQRATSNLLVLWLMMEPKVLRRPQVVVWWRAYVPSRSRSHSRKRKTALCASSRPQASAAAAAAYQRALGLSVICHSRRCLMHDRLRICIGLRGDGQLEAEIQLL